MSTYKILKYLYVSNFIVSSVLVLHFYYLDYRTVTTLVTNVILCWSKVMKGYTLAKKSFDEEIAISYYNIIHLSFNDLDEDYMIKNTPNIELVPKNQDEDLENKIKPDDLQIELKNSSENV